jgi:D-amino-acid dehydrogenase
MRVAVIGGGVIGLACAYELQKRGVETVVLEAGEIGRAASWGNAGWIVPALSGPIPSPGLTLTSLRWLLSDDSPLYIKPRLDPAFARWLWTFWRHCNLHDYLAGFDAMASLNRHTMDLYDSWRFEGVRFEMHAAGLLFAFLTTRKLHEYVEDHDRLQSHGYPTATVLTGDDMRAIAPILSPEIVGGFLIDRERHVEPASLTAGLAARLREMSGEVRTGTTVTGVSHVQRRSGRRIIAVDTNRGRVEADAFLLAAGAWSAGVARVAGVRLPVESGKGYSITIEQPAVELTQPLYLAEAMVGVSPFDSGLRIAGTMELSGISESINARRLASLRRSTSRFLTAWPRGEREVEWAGMRPLTPDGLPLLGRVPTTENLFVATGHSMLGVTLAPVTGRLMAELIASGHQDPDLQPFDPGRFVARGRRRRHM